MALASPKVLVSVFNEAQCPGCIDFSKTQLNAVMTRIPEIVSLSIFPFGNANETVNEDDGSYSFDCQHGYNECVSNMYEACAQSHFPAIDSTTHQPAWYPFFHCIESSDLATDRIPLPYNFSMVQECARSANINYDVLKECVGESPEVGDPNDGNLIMHEVSEATTRSGNTFCPWVVVEGYGVLTEDQIDNGDDLVKIICDTYEGTAKPGGCY